MLKVSSIKTYSPPCGRKINLCNVKIAQLFNSINNQILTLQLSQIVPTFHLYYDETVQKSKGQTFLDMEFVGFQPKLSLNFIMVKKSDNKRHAYLAYFGEISWLVSESQKNLFI